MRRWPLRLWLPAIAIGWMSVACGNSPSEPSPVPQQATRSYLGLVTFPDGQGFLSVSFSTSTSAASLSRVGWFTGWLDLIEPRLLAQTAASGVLSLADGTVVRLAGTHTSGAIQLTGGDYAVAVAIAGDAIAGTVTTPAGTVAVTPELAGVAMVGAPPTPQGTYSGTYSMVAAGYFLNRHVATGQIERNCAYTVAITGTLTIEIHSPGFVSFGDRWREDATIAAGCPGVTQFTKSAETPAGTSTGET